ncbi:MAG: cytochrome b/b6 domain-containing protein [Acetobacteraceae bacterium]
MAHTTIYRHSIWLRLTHWINALCLTLLLMSGLQILNAHPALYWGQKSIFLHPLLALGDGVPSWLTVPHDQDLATGRRWHFFFAWLFVANGLAYLLLGLIGGHVRRDLLPAALNCAASAAPSSSIFACTFRAARKRGRTMSYRSSPT